MKKFKHLSSYIWICFAAFTLAILVLLWIAQTILLPSYYEHKTNKNIENSAALISHNIESPKLNTLIESLAYQFNLSVVITDVYGNVNFYADYMHGDSILFRDNGLLLFGFRNELIMDENGTFLKTIENEQFDTKDILYGHIVKISENDARLIFINTSVAPLDSTVKIIRSQILDIGIILLIIAFVITMFISKKLSQPIVDITKTANQLASGNFDVKFEGGAYFEIQELSDAMNFACSELSKVDTLRRDLISNVSHDLRTPLTMIKAYSEMIRDLSGDDPIKREEHLNVIIDEADRLSHLVNELLELSKLESGNLDLEISTFSSHEFIDDILSRYKILVERDGYEFVYEKTDDRVCVGDRRKLEQVLFNFINNAVNYGRESKKIIIRTINLPNAIRVEVEDFGPGIAKENLPLVFDRYYRDIKNTRDIVGTGLGLSISKEILKKHSYPFGVKSELQRGSTFWFEIKANSCSDDE